MAAMTVREVLYMYSVAWQAYNRFLSVCGNPEKAQNAVALLVWLDQGTISAIHHVPPMVPDVIVVVAEEANAVLECLRHQKPALPPIPIISALCMQGGVHIEPGFFTFHQDLVVRGTGMIVNPPELMVPYTSQPVAVSEDCRSMFITFSKGNALHHEEIFEYFRHKWGDCVVRVLMEKTKGGHMPMYGRIIFKTEAIGKLVLNGEMLVKIPIGQREIWLRKYVPRPTKAAV
ncbi:unnamed protein product [Triticum turgidum subsp. durum]|uniref:RRM domain-containing protein n=1 Tax=Triticum turgidum subsp. durum TaxID=4567 RepID=A0A9R1QZ99_TRITD|nr:unnamed protein product [Triticum turgidum subsp. durum]